ncbi:RagB/SusD family nutrient uptake outer membrane protein [Sphingobacterium thalpophilum]|uniref:RagB/SusD family nutrient uptake outer membrane protein n=1 Tax=Sphingobacterium thalpophilum TaxID=259 RepID=A0ACD5C754_9SPHI|nr:MULTISPECIES: RagB/SusD family nutrient uptake outer membrane protein [Sphingobacterium]
MKNILSTKMVIGIVMMLMLGCNQFLEEKSDMSLATISSKSDLYALMDYTVVMNQSYVAAVGDIASDDFFILDKQYMGISQLSDRAIYIWDRKPLADWYWVSYSRILNVNTVLEHLDKIQLDQKDRRNLEGMALFFRAYSYFDLAQIYAPAYNQKTAELVLGPPMKMSTDVNDKPIRLSLKETMNLIIADLKLASDYLTDQNVTYPTRPNRNAALGLLSRVYLAMGDYEQALATSNRALESYDQLMDYNQIDRDKKYPFERFNPEVLFFSIHAAENLSRESVLRIDTVLYDSYTDSDLRKTRFFSKQADGYFAFTGDYSGNSNAQKFNGITTAELWLTKAECEARLGQLTLASKTIKFLTDKRYSSTVAIEPFPAAQDELLKFIYAERRKELLLRGIRWMDLRRLEDKYIGKKEIRRIIEGKIYSIDLNEVKNFTFLFPQKVIEMSDMEQN